MMARRSATALVFSLSLGVSLGACGDSSRRLGSTARLEVVLSGTASTRDAPLPLTFNTPAQFTFSVAAQKADGSIDSGFNGFVRISIKPGSVVSLSGENTTGRNVRLINGVAENLTLGTIG